MSPHEKPDTFTHDSLERARRSNCTACDNHAPSDPHHVTTRKAGGTDEANNIMPLCRRCHVRLHQEGYSKMMLRHPSVRQWLIDNGREDVLARAQR